MTFANMGSLGTQPGRQDEVVALLTRPSAELAEIGCLLYEVGVSNDAPDEVFVMELWTSEEAHQGSLQRPSVQAAIRQCMPMLNGKFSSMRFTVKGSPLRS